MQSLFREEDWRLTVAGEDLDRVTNQAVRHIFQQYLNDGYNAREIAHIMFGAITDLELCAVLDKDSSEKIPVVAYPGT